MKSKARMYPQAKDSPVTSKHAASFGQNLRARLRPQSSKPGRHRAPEPTVPSSKDGALVAGAVAVVVAAILLAPGAVTVASPDVAPVAQVTTAVCQ